MADDIEVNTAEFQRAAQRLKDAGLQKELAKSIRDVAQPFGKYVLLKGAQKLPAKGGLRDRVASGTVRVQATSLRAAVTLTTRQKYKLGAMDAGTIRHPVFERTKAVTTRKWLRKTTTQVKLWVDQAIPAHAFTDAFNEDAPAIQQKIVDDVTELVNRLAQGET